ncbi:hypothetical protein D3C72_2367240 [compost metagenome]
MRNATELSHPLRLQFGTKERAVDRRLHVLDLQGPCEDAARQTLAHNRSDVEHSDVQRLGFHLAEKGAHLLHLVQ